MQGARTWLFFRCFVNCNSLRVIGLGQFCVSVMGGGAQSWAEGKEPVGRKEIDAEERSDVGGASPAEKGGGPGARVGACAGEGGQLVSRGTASGGGT